MMLRLSAVLLLGSCFLSSSMAQDEKTTAPESPQVTKIGENLYRLGEIRIDAKAREVSFPGVVNMREGGPIEYVLVHETGKVHEAIFTTAVPPLHLQIALKLLKYKDGHGDVFNRLLAPEVLEKEGGEKKDRGNEVTVRFTVADEEPVPASETIIDGATANPMEDAPWIYTGSTIEDGTFMAEAEGSIVAIYLDHLAMFNMAREGADTDDRWGANSKAIPDIGTKVTLHLAPAKTDVTK